MTLYICYIPLIKLLHIINKICSTLIIDYKVLEKNFIKSLNIYINDVKNKFYALYITHMYMQSRSEENQFAVWKRKKHHVKAHANLPKIGLFRF